ncbi:MAG: PA-phosphatase-like phosphoesterase [Bacteroidetes bacterium]|nr:MAG: PA-phosphatase-like phosphoesterase [Bacteroidota bacterium]
MNKNSNHPFLLFLGIMLIYQFLLSVLVIVYGYEGSFLLLNGFHPNGFDAPMFLMTHLGDALILTSLLGFLFIRRDPALVILIIIVVIITGLTGQLMKNFLFDSWDRPLSVLGDKGKVYTVYGYRLFRNSFPSGHSITVAAAITTLVMVLKPGKPVIVVLAILTALISYTRIYVGAHFAGDVLAGTIIGIAGSAYLTTRFYPAVSRWVEQLPGRRLSLIKITLFAMAVSGMAGGIIMAGDYLKLMIE